MKKSLLLVLLTLFMFSTALQTYAKVDTNTAEAQKIVTKANAQIDSVINVSQTSAEKVILKYDAGKISLEEKDLVLDAIINKMISKTDKISKRAIAKAARINVVIECSYIEVIIDSRVILVDPLHIVGS